MKNLFQSISTRIILAVVVIAIILQTVTVINFSEKQIDNEITSEVKAARNLVLMAESVRQNMEKKWELGLFSTEQLKAVGGSSPEEIKSKILAAVPVVSAWEAAKAKAEEGGFTFRTPRVNARNPENEPDQLELKALEFLKRNPAETEVFYVDEKINAVRYFRPVRLGAICMNCHGDPATSFQIWDRDDGRDITGFKMDNKKVGDMHGAFEVIRPLAEADARIATGVMEIIALGLISLILITTIIWYLVNRIVKKPIDRALNALVQAEETNDLTVRLDENITGEVGTMAKAFNRFIERINHLTGETVDVAYRLNDMSSQLSTFCSQADQGMKSQEEDTIQVATAMTEMVATVQEVASSTSIAAGAAHSAGDAVNKGTTTIESFTEMVSQLAGDMRETTSVVTKLDTDSEAISTILDVIRGIAEQTNLLALNAAIEAARAGEQGRGFAVVADEVRTLAQRTQESTQEIESMIEKVQEGAKNAAVVMEQGHSRIDKGAQKTAEVENALNEISDQVDRIVEMSTQIATAAEEQTMVAEEMNQNIHRISEVTSETAEGTNETIAAAHQLYGLSEKLHDQVCQFKV